MYKRQALARYQREKRKYDRIMARGKQAGWELAEANVTDLELIKANIDRLIQRLQHHYEAALNGAGGRDYRRETVDMIDYLMHNASGVVDKAVSYTHLYDDVEWAAFVAEQGGILQY